MIWTILAFIGCCVLVFILRGLGELRAKTEKSEKYVTKYPTKWDWKLEELGIKEEWDREFIDYLNLREVNAETYISLLSASESFKLSMFKSFRWEETEKGYSFWHEISEK